MLITPPSFSLRPNPDRYLTMPSPRLLSAAFLSAALALSACDGSGEHNVPDEAEQQTTADSAAAGTDIPSTLPPAGTVNPAAPAGTGTYGDSASPAAVGPSQGATPGSSNPATPVQSGAASDSAR
jgi:hypothetical protein